MEVNMFEGDEIYTEVNRTTNSNSFTLADEVGQECGDEIMNFTCNDEQFPEYMMCNSVERIPCKELLSPKFIPRAPKFKLNLDIPEDISNSDDTYDKNHGNNERIHDIKINLHHAKLSQETSLTSEQIESIKLNNEKPTNIDTKQQIPVCVNNRTLYNKCDNRTIEFCYQNIGSSSVLPSTKLIHNVNLTSNDVVQSDRDISPTKIIIPDSQNNKNDNAKIETHVSMDESSIFYHNNRMNNNLSFKLQWWKVPFTKCYGFSYWLSSRIFQLIKTNYQRFRQFFPRSATLQCPEESNEKVCHITSIIRAENERMLSLFTEKFNNMAQELNQIHVLNETTLSVLKTQLDILKNTSNKLLNNNDVVSREMKVLFRKFDDKFKINSTTLSRVNESVCGIPPPPPPPPPPPILLSLSATPNCQSRSRILPTSTRKCSTPLTSIRPVITVEDLRKVTLKKAPQRNKENDPMNNVQTPRGPLISLDMLRSVKLKSTRRNKSNAADAKNVRSPRRTFKGHGTPNFSLSPIMAGAVSPLSGILKRVDNRWASKKTLMSPIRSDNDLTKDSPKRLNIARPSNSSHTIIV